MKFLSKISFLSCLLILILSGIFMISGHNGFASWLLNLSFWIIVAGVIFYIWEARGKHEA